jgi:DNA topoisomerase-1
MKLITAIPGPPKLSPEEKKARAEKGKQERIIGTFESHPIEFYLGRFGPFVKHNGSNYSLPKTMTDQSSITEAIAIKAITASRPLVDYECTLDTKEGRIRAVNGPYGIYLKFVPKSGKAENYFLPKDLKTDEAGVRALTLEQCLEHVQSAKEYKKNPPKKAGKTRKGRGGKFTRSKRGGKN